MRVIAWSAGHSEAVPEHEVTGPTRRRRRLRSARMQLLGFVTVWIVASAVAAAVLGASTLATLLGWDVAIAVYVAWVWAVTWRLDGHQTGIEADYVDPARAVADLLLLTAAVASLVAVGAVLASAKQYKATQDLRIALALASVVLSWALVHTVFMLRYARLYYTGEDGGVDFKQDAPPAYSDFAYLSFTIGMTFQVSDTDLKETRFRRTALGHGVLSYAFATGIVAAAINLVASLSSQ
jgi:uncharacterized membrane protein